MSVLVVTGGSRGIGKAVALGAAARGWHVVFSYASNDEAAQQTRTEVRAAGVQCEMLRGDTADEAHLEALFDTGAAIGTIDRCVVNAGIVAPASPLVDMDTSRIRNLINVNVTGALLTAREAARRILPGKGGAGGSIVLLSSAVVGKGGANRYVDYAASKGAIDILTKGLSQELAPSVRVNAVRPGIIDTDIHADAGDADRAAKVGPGLPLGRVGTPEEAAAAVLWLLSDEASYVTGAHLDVAGGV